MFSEDRFELRCGQDTEDETSSVHRFKRLVLREIMRPTLFQRILLPLMPQGRARSTHKQLP